MTFRSSLLEQMESVSLRQLGVRELPEYALVIDARSPREYFEDHIPGAVNLPVVDDEQYAEVGTTHKTDKHAAYLIGVEYSLRNIAAQIKPLISNYRAGDRMLVYCFRGGKRSRLWADNLRTIGFEVDVLTGGWKRYRQWVRDSLASLSTRLDLRVLAGPTGCGKTRLLAALSSIGEQVLDLEAVANHRGSLLGAVPGTMQPTQKGFDSALLHAMRRLDSGRRVWVEAESKKIGNLQLPEQLFERMHSSPVVHLTAPMEERVQLWRKDYPYLVADPRAMVRQLEPLKPLVGGEVLKQWQSLAEAGNVGALFEAVMRQHYDPCYERSTRRNYRPSNQQAQFELLRLDMESLALAASDIAKSSP